MDIAELNALVDLVSELVAYRLGMEPPGTGSRSAEPGQPGALARARAAPEGPPNHKWITIEDEFLDGDDQVLLSWAGQHRPEIDASEFGKAIERYYRDLMRVVLPELVEDPTIMQAAGNVVRVAREVVRDGRSFQPNHLEVINSFLEKVEPYTIQRDLPALSSLRDFFSQSVGRNATEMLSVIATGPASA